jgi:hypothetical protein
MNSEVEIEESVSETDIDQIIEELEAEVSDENEDTIGKPFQPLKKQVGCRSFWQNFKRSWFRSPPKSGMVHRFQTLAGIIDNSVVASVTLPNGARVDFRELPAWWWVIRFKLCGFKYETYFD